MILFVMKVSDTTDEIYCLSQTHETLRHFTVVIVKFSRTLFPKFFKEQTRHITLFSRHRKMKACDAKIGHWARKRTPRIVRPHFLFP